MSVFDMNEGILSSLEHWGLEGQPFSHSVSQSSAIWPESGVKYSKPNSLRIDQRTTPGSPLQYQVSTEPTVPKLRPSENLFRTVDRPIDVSDVRNTPIYPPSETPHTKPPVKLYASEDLYSQANKDLLRYKLQDRQFDSGGNALIRQAIKPPGLKDFAVTNFIEGDGNCQFYAVSMVLQGNPDLHQDLRASAVTYMKDNKEDFQHFVVLDGQHKTWDEYCTNMSKDKEYGDQLTLLALARKYQRNFLVVSDSENHNSVLVVPVQGSEAKDEPYLPLYLNQLHYELVLKDDGSSNLKDKNTNFPINSNIHNQPTSSASSQHPQNGVRTTESAAARILPVEADTLPDSDRIPLIDRTQPEAQHPNARIAPDEADTIPDLDRVPLIDRTQLGNDASSPLYGARLSRKGNRTRNMYRSRLWSRLLESWRMNFRSIWTRIMSMFRRHRKKS